MRLSPMIVLVERYVQQRQKTQFLVIVVLLLYSVSKNNQPVHVTG
ncbi:hypothetical protein Ga0466249_003074 [Sporomusaceae bacterium BoRhaA]|nr:hypothetical protein [Pelorhabdus rhamnosifermentans]